MSLPMPPCVKDCPERSQNCHGKCDKYISWAKERRELTRKARELDSMKYLSSEKHNQIKAIMVKKNRPGKWNGNKYEG